MSTKTRIIKDVQIVKGKVLVGEANEAFIDGCSVNQLFVGLKGKDVRVSIQTNITKTILKSEDKGSDK